MKLAKQKQQKNTPRPASEEKTWKSETETQNTTNWALITKWWRIVSDLGWNLSRTKMGMNPKTKKGEMEDIDLGVFAERDEITPLGGGSKISEEDLPLWIGDSKIRIGGSEENLETWDKTQIFI